ncbi:MAG: hypothetical protein EB036_12815 [Betaproteobacteria bacterium]|nr:hypothetical protein [Betaproteobacteria bacterium]
MLGMATRAQQVFDEGRRMGPDLEGPGHQARCTPAGHGLMGRCHVCINRAVPPLVGAADMAGHARALVKQLNGVRSDAGIQLHARKAIRHRVVVALNLNVVINAHPAAFPLGVGVTDRGQRLKRWPIQRIKGRAAAAGQLLEGAIVQVL